jgi:hypothetical protein
MNLQMIGFVLLLFMTFICSSPCTRSFPQRFALSQHQSTCSIHQQIQALVVTQRRELVLKRKRCHSVRNEGSNKRVSHHYPQQVHLVTSRPAFGVYANAFNFINHRATSRCVFANAFNFIDHRATPRRSAHTPFSITTRLHSIRKTPTSASTSIQIS